MECLQYLFAAIDARAGRAKQANVKGTGRAKYNPIQLKKLIVDASEGVVSHILLFERLSDGVVMRCCECMLILLLACSATWPLRAPPAFS